METNALDAAERDVPRQPSKGSSQSLLLSIILLGMLAGRIYISFIPLSFPTVSFTYPPANFRSNNPGYYSGLSIPHTTPDIEIRLAYSFQLSRLGRVAVEARFIPNARSVLLNNVIYRGNTRSFPLPALVNTSRPALAFDMKTAVRPGPDLTEISQTLRIRPMDGTFASNIAQSVAVKATISVRSEMLAMYITSLAPNIRFVLELPWLRGRYIPSLNWAAGAFTFESKYSRRARYPNVAMNIVGRAKIAEVKQAYRHLQGIYRCLYDFKFLRSEFPE